MLEAIAVDLHAAMAAAIAFVPCEKQVSVPAIRIVAFNQRKLLIGSKRNQALRHGSLCLCLDLIARPLSRAPEASFAAQQPHWRSAKLHS